MTILGWFENIPSDDMPPRWMWHLTDELEQFFEELKERRKSGQPRDDDDDLAPGQTIRNQYAKGRGR
jgi:hypothetical protein